MYQGQILGKLYLRHFVERQYVIRSFETQIYTITDCDTSGTRKLSCRSVQTSLLSLFITKAVNTNKLRGDCMALGLMKIFLIRSLNAEKFIEIKYVYFYIKAFEVLKEKFTVKCFSWSLSCNGSLLNRNGNRFIKFWLAMQSVYLRKIIVERAYLIWYTAIKYRIHTSSVSVKIINGRFRQINGELYVICFQ
jgi:hypothetical protein